MDAEKEKFQNEYEFVLPNLVIKELIAVLIASSVLLIWSMAVNAPLLSIADPNKTENPAKAPWYFVGLQELLVYFDPWIAGVTIPVLIILGLMLIPYLDINRTGAGTYCFRERKTAVSNFVFGFAMWIILILVGQFLRGPNWQFYWLWEDWSVAKSAEESLVNMPQWAGIGFLVVYFGAGLTLPAILSKELFRKMGAARYFAAFTLVLLMYGVVIKIFLRLIFNIRYILTTPWFNI
ncbi:MAG: hypothetical protein JSV16_06045 [Candidatus Hydrogenedentota bacterium]|nr:MAG: hypothetical protein JSV16_06045 [Candidatus Hydrogenedentota bacterium]